LPTRMGSAIFENAPPAAQDASCVALLREAGAVIIGKTVTTELASFVPSHTRNPLSPPNLDYTPGGSSAGSAAAVAAGHVDIAIGTQTAGSILRPAAYCGVIGFKPSVGLVATDGVLIQSPTLDTIGVFARSIDDCAVWLAAMTGQSCDINALKKRENFNNLQRLNIGFVNHWQEHASPEMRAALIDILGKLTQQGYTIRNITLPAPLGNIDVTQKTIQDVESSRAYTNLVGVGMSAPLQEATILGNKISEATYQAALKSRGTAIVLASNLLAASDIWIMPAATGGAQLGLASTGNPIFNRLASGLGVPALSLPLNLPRVSPQMPLSIQLIGAMGNDAKLLKAAHLINIALRPPNHVGSPTNPSGPSHAGQA